MDVLSEINLIIIIINAFIECLTDIQTNKN